MFVRIAPPALWLGQYYTQFIRYGCGTTMPIDKLINIILPAIYRSGKPD
jgi:hypothetical protein